MISSLKLCNNGHELIGYVVTMREKNVVDYSHCPLCERIKKMEQMHQRAMELQEEVQRISEMIDSAKEDDDLPPKELII